MLNLQDTYDFYDGLVLAGLKPFRFDRAFRDELDKDMQQRFSYATREELLEASEEFKNGTHWPTYKELEEELSALRDVEAETEEEETWENAYPEGKAWQQATRDVLSKHIKREPDSFTPYFVLQMHNYMQMTAECNKCPGKGCPFGGHHPRLDSDEEYKHIRLCMEEQLCERYV